MQTVPAGAGRERCRASLGVACLSAALTAALTGCGTPAAGPRIEMLGQLRGGLERVGWVLVGEKGPSPELAAAAARCAGIGSGLAGANGRPR